MGPLWPTQAVYRPTVHMPRRLVLTLSLDGQTDHKKDALFLEEFNHVEQNNNMSSTASFFSENERRYLPLRTF